MAVVAITGDIGAGKSTAAKLFAKKLSASLIDADKITAELWQSEKVKNIFVARFGNEILDPSGEIIKSEISRRIFSDFKEYEFCNSVLHPLVMSELENKSIEAKLKNQNLVLEIPLLFEACETRPAWLDKIVYVTASFELRLRRCEIQRGWNINELKRRESFLLPQHKKISLCDFVLENDGDLEKLEKAIRI
ncbi:MAG: dephospho-CoA kinase [Synergistaceae bacterium]|nr:dephospho-CoA kinase [Synergistaceae bacterium]